jgi:hypothetical protein
MSAEHTWAWSESTHSHDATKSRRGEGEDFAFGGKTKKISSLSQKFVEKFKNHMIPYYNFSQNCPI